VEAGCKKGGRCCKGAIVPLHFEKALFCPLTFNWQNFKKKAELLAWKENKRLSSKPRGLDLNVFFFLFVLILSMHVYAILLFLFILFILLGKNLPIHCLLSPTTLSQLT
jgi:hypothetical protein